MFTWSCFVKKKKSQFFIGEKGGNGQSSLAVIDDPLPFDWRMSQTHV